ncbi:Protein phosphatase inhibitor 2 (IPP-2) family protein [Candida albicans]|uniref:Protein phosphatase inhibitor 2 (IPP-2) family protein n=1 Tax=Candida albicans TaxID=5476 RepID=A0A8H6F221_CANAX|nr:Protein phosphatase inhibitor 2 (IPP-2) family protein [Candida albicans]
MSDTSPKGILRNKPEDRNEVIKNTRLNAQLASESSKGDEIRAKIAEKKKEQGLNSAELPEHLKWDEINLYKNEQEKTATMKIDEPKTPYEGGFNPEGEYYRDDDDNEGNGNGEVDDIPAFELGEGEFDKLPHETSGKGEDKEEDSGERELTAEEKHKRFEEMRKQHYHMKALPLKQKIEIPDEDDEE